MKAFQFIAGLTVLLSLASCSDQLNPEHHLTPFERSDSLETTTYEEGIAWWRTLEEASPYVCVQEFGETDAGLPLHIAIINAGRNFSPSQVSSSGKAIWLINNAIHPGEPDGVDASMLFAREILSDPDFKSKYSDVVILIIPFYNVGGVLNRNCCSRANQNGPVSYGFRGNARNLDLNRDFTKADSRNAQSFIKLFHIWDPDVYLETHVSNGADYPYTMTYLLSHPDKLTPPLNTAMGDLFETPLVEAMKAAGDEMIPYVNLFGTTPDSGYQRFYDSPRYSTGFTAQHHAFGMLTETHMLKPFKRRVASTLTFLHALGLQINNEASKIQSLRDEAIQNSLQQERQIIDWKVDTSSYSNLLFKGYKARYDTSKVTGALQLHYDQNEPWEREIPYYDKLIASQYVDIPQYYLVPVGWKQVVDRLKWNGVKMKLIERDSSLDVQVYSIDNMETRTSPYEGHYYHYGTTVASETERVEIKGGSYYLVSTDHKERRFIVETLEPSAPDSYFNWNFFDEILQQKEWFSSYVFEKEAEEMLKDPEHRAAFDTFLATNTGAQENSMAQLYFLYQRSEHFERGRYRVYPVFSIE